MNEINSRIKEFVENSGMKKGKIAEKLNISQPFLSQICAGVRNPSDRTIADICREFNISEEWLRTGKGEPYARKDREDQLTEAVNGLLSGENPEFKRRLVKVLSTLNESQWTFLEEKLAEIMGNHESAAVSAMTAVEEEAETIPPLTKEEAAEVPGKERLSEKEIRRRVAEYEALLRGRERLKDQIAEEKIKSALITSGFKPSGISGDSGTNGSTGKTGGIA